MNLLTYVFTDMHAKCTWANGFNQLEASISC